MFVAGQGLEQPPRISFRKVDPFNLWVRQRCSKFDFVLGLRAASGPGIEPSRLCTCTRTDQPQLWFEFAQGPPTKRELDLLQTMLQAWFMVGKMGGYNSQNMQVRAEHAWLSSAFFGCLFISQANDGSNALIPLGLAVGASAVGAQTSAFHHNSMLACSGCAVALLPSLHGKHCHVLLYSAGVLPSR